jgi:4-amino-4-deoxy-L-arabinose transferase-like glycosyltransferase
MWPNQVTFGYEQARDALAAQNIFSQKKLTLIGPTTEITGLFHGPTYYYLIGPFYYLLGKNPAPVALLHLLINITTIPLIFFIGRDLFNQRVGLIASFIFAISYEVSSYSLWLSNPSPGLPFIILTYYLFYKSLRQNPKYLPLATFLFAISVQSDLIIVTQIIPLFLLYYFYRPQTLKLKILFSSAITFSLALINYPLFEARHHFLMTRKFFEILISQDSQPKTIFTYLSTFLNGFAQEFANVLFPVHGFFAGILMLILFFYLWRKIKSTKITQNPWFFLLIWLLSTFPPFLISAAMTSSEFAFFGTNAPIALLAAVSINSLMEKKRIFLASSCLFIIFFANLRAWNNYFPNPQRKLFDAQRGVVLKDTLAAINYTYTESAGQPFFVNTLTVPLYISPLWNYLYSWHGQEKFGYLPSQNPDTLMQFLIIEPGWGQTYEIFRQKTIDLLNQKTQLEEKKTFGFILVEKRSLLTNQLKPQE